MNTVKSKGGIYCKSKSNRVRFIAGIVLFVILPFLSQGQCPVINTAMINACAQPPSTAEGINEFVYFTTTSSASASNYVLSYGVANPPLGGGSTNTLSGANAVAQNGPGSLISSNGCTITYVTSPATVIPAGSGVIMIPSNFDNTYDLTGICTGTTLYAILVDITAAPSNTWGPGGTMANSSGSSPRYLQVSNGASNCQSNLVTYSGNGWPTNGDGNSVWWGGGSPTYQNNGCSMIKPPKPTVTPSAIAAVCEYSTSASMPFTTTGNPNQYSIDWDNAANTAGIADVNAATLTASPLSITLPSTAPAGTYTGSLTVINSLTPDTSVAQNISITITPAPIISVHPSTTIQNVCQNGAVTPLSVAATAGSGSITGYQWFITTNNNNTSGAAIPFATSSSYTPSSANIGTIYFYCKVTNSNGCTTTSNVSGALIVSPNIATPTATATQQPTCALPTGTITVTAPTGANIQYSVNGVGGPYQVSGTFTGLAPNTTYNITAKNMITGCESPVKSVAINALPPAPATPVASATQQPTCALPTGTITITAPIGVNYEYSVGGGYQPTLVFAGLTNGTTYNVVVRDINTGCVSNPLPVTIDPIAGAPAKPTITAVQTSCNNTTGSITITAPLNSNFEYSIGGAYQSGVSFSGLPPATLYHITVRDIITGCISAPLDTSMDAIPTLPPPTIATPLISYCQNETATILSAATTFPGAALQWYNTLNGGTASATAPTPTTTTAGIFKFYISQKIGSCESNRDSITVTINPTPALPNTAGNTTVYCENTTATVLTATGTNLQWYDVATGGLPLPGGAPTPSTFTAGPVTYYVTQTVNGCESGRAPITITVNPTPAAPTVSNPVVQFCQNSTPGTLSATGSNLLWYNQPLGGAGSATTPTISTTNTGSSFYYVSQTVNGCESGRSIITVTVVAVPTPPQTSPVEYCLNSVAVPLTATGINLQWYTTLSSATPLPTAPTPLTTTAGSTKYYVSQLINTCESRRDSVLVTIKPISPAPTVISPLEFCQNTTATQLTATGTNLLWYDASFGGSGSPTAPVPLTTTPGTSFFYVTQNTTGCESSPRTAITVTIKVTSTAVAGFHYLKDTACLNGMNPVPAYDLGFTNGGIFTASPAGLSIDAATGVINLASSSTGNYKIVYNYTTTGCINGNSADDSIVLAAAVPTNIIFSYASPVCKDAAPVMPQTQANFTLGGLFSSNPGLSLNSSTGEVNVVNSTPGNYQVTYSLPEVGCRLATSRFSFINVTDTSSPVTAFTYSSTDVCLTGGAVNPTITKAPGFTPGGTFTVTPAGLSVNSTTGDINIGLSVPGVYIIKYSVPASGCRYARADSITFRLRTYGNPVTNFSYFSPVCKGDNNAIAVTDPLFTGGGTFSSVAGVVVDATSGAVDLRQSIPGLYTIRYDVPTGVCNPAGFNTADITILALPAAPAVTSGSVCGQGTINLTASASGTISWYTEPGKINQVNVGNTFSVFADHTTTYYVTNTVGTCESEPALANAFVSPVPAKPFIGNDTSICTDDRIILNAGSYNTYLWQDGSTNSTYIVTNPGTYSVIVSTGIGCSDTADITISPLGDCGDIYFPNAFAPNGVNKTFGAAGNLFTVSRYLLRIYNRYGEEVFATADPYKKWDGTYKGKPVTLGAYVFVATYLYKNQMEKVRKGTVMVLR